MMGLRIRWGLGVSVAIAEEVWLLSVATVLMIVNRVEMMPAIVPMRVMRPIVNGSVRFMLVFLAGIRTGVAFTLSVQ